MLLYDRLRQIETDSGPLSEYVSRIESLVYERLLGARAIVRDLDTGAPPRPRGAAHVTLAVRRTPTAPPQRCAEARRPPRAASNGPRSTPVRLRSDLYRATLSNPAGEEEGDLPEIGLEVERVEGGGGVSGADDLEPTQGGARGSVVDADVDDVPQMTRIPRPRSVGNSPGECRRKHHNGPCGSRARPRGVRSPRRSANLTSLRGRAPARSPTLGRPPCECPG